MNVETDCCNLLAFSFHRPQETVVQEELLAAVSCFTFGARPCGTVDNLFYPPRGSLDE